MSFGRFSTDITGDTAAGSYATEVFVIPGADIPANAVLSFQATSNPVAWNLDDVSVTSPTIPEPPAGAILGGAALIVLSLRFRARMTAG